MPSFICVNGLAKLVHKITSVIRTSSFRCSILSYRMYHIQLRLATPATSNIYTSYSKMLYSNNTKDKMKTLVTIGAILQNAMQDKSKDSFHSAIDKFMTRDRQRRGHVDFIYAALKVIDKFGLQDDLETYNKLLDVIPRDRFVTRTWLDRVWPKPYPQIDCALDLLTKMEEEGILPDDDTYRILHEVFGKRSLPLMKAARMEFWFTLLKDVNPYKLPTPAPTDLVAFSTLALQRISGSDGSITIYHNTKDSGNHIFLTTAQSPTQKELLLEYDTSKPLLVEGPFRVWLSKYPQFYYVLRAHASIKIGKEEDDEGLVVGTCMIGGDSSDMLHLWIDKLKKEIPRLSEVEVIFDINRISPLSVIDDDSNKAVDAV